MGDDAGLEIGFYEVEVSEGDAFSKLTTFKLANGGKAFVEIDGL